MSYIFIEICLCVCSSYCVFASDLNTSPTEAQIWTRFSHWLGPYWNWWPWVKPWKIKVTVAQYPFSFHNSLLTSLPWISALLCPIIMKFGMSLRYMPMADLCVNFIQIEWVMTSLWRHLSFLHTIVHISNSIEPTNFLLGTNIQK